MGFICRAMDWKLWRLTALLTVLLAATGKGGDTIQGMVRHNRTNYRNVVEA